MYKIIANPSNHTSLYETFYRPAPRPVARGCNGAIAPPFEKNSTIVPQTNVHVTQKSLNRLSDW